MADLSLTHMHIMLATAFEPVLTRFAAPGGEPDPHPFSQGGRQ